MKKRTHLHVTICIAIILTFFACSSGKYGEAKAVMKKQAEIGMAYANALENAKNAGDVAKAINTYTDEMEKLIPGIKKMMKDIPEITTQEAPPQELVEESAKLAETGEKMEAATQKLVQYITDPQVQKALEHMNVVMQKLIQQG